MSESEKIKVIIVEDHELMRDGLKAALNKDGRFEVVAEAADGLTAVHKVAQIKPDVVVMDIGLPQIDGLEATKQIKAAHPTIKIVMLTSHENDAEIFQALQFGANGYCLKDLAGDKLMRAIQSVSEGAAWIDPRIAGKVLSHFAQPQETVQKQDGVELPALSQREKDVLKLMVEGLSNKEIAERLVIGASTVRTHVEHILEKLAVSGRTEAAVKATKHKLI